MSPTAEEQDIIDTFNCLTPSQKKLVLGTIDALSPPPEKLAITGRNLD